MAAAADRVGRALPRSLPTRRDDGPLPRAHRRRGRTQPARDRAQRLPRRESGWLAACARAVELPREILADPDFIRLHRTIARALAACPRLDEQAVQDLTLAAGIPPPEGVTTP